MKKYVLYGVWIVVMVAAGVKGLGQYIVNFEGAGETKTGYASGAVNLSGIEWNLTDVLIGTESGEVINGSRSARLRGHSSSVMTMLANKTTGLGTLTFDYRQYSTDSQITWRVDYSTDNGSTWTQLGPTFTANATVQTFTATLNQAGNIRIRIIHHSGGDMSNRRMNIDDITLTDYPASGLYYRSATSGNWNAPSTWQSSTDNINWAAATSTPTNVDNTITIQAGHTVTITAGVTIDEVVVAEGGTLVRSNVGTTLNNGPGIDLDVQGTYTDNGTSASPLTVSGSPTWRLGANGTFIKTGQADAQVYRERYEGGMSTIPSSAQWIIRKTGTDRPAFTTVNTFYPNLTIEDLSGLGWSPAPSFEGSTGGTATIKGTFDVGGSGGTLNLVNNNTNTNPITVQGNLVVKSSATLSNGTSGGTGFAVEGNVTVHGALNLSSGSGDAGQLRFSGSNHQTVSGTGTINIRRLIIHKSGGKASLERHLTATDELVLTNGNIELHTYILTLGSSATVSGGSASSYVQTNSSGVFKRTVSTSAALFPVGNSAYNPAWLTRSTGSGVYNARVRDEVLSDGTSGVPVTANVVNRTWDITADASVGTLTLEVQWSAAQETSGFNRSACYVSHYTSSWQQDAPGAASGSNPYMRSRSGITSLSPFAVASSPALPIELLSFTAKRSGNAIHLGWRTATELHNDYMAIERSADATRWQELGRVPGAGTTSTPQEYTFIDQKPLPGLNYYRIRQVDYDGTAAYHQVISLDFRPGSSNAAALHLYPSPARERLYVALPAPAAHDSELWLLDVQGRRLQRLIIPQGGEQGTFEVEALPTGVYFVRLAAGDARSFRFVR